MTDGLAVLAGWLQLVLLVAILCFIVWRKSPTEDDEEEMDRGGDG